MTIDPAHAKLIGVALALLAFLLSHHQVAAAQGEEPAASARTLTGFVQNQDLRRVDQAIVRVRDVEGTIVAEGITNQAGKFSVTVPQEGTYSVGAVQDT